MLAFTSYLERVIAIPPSETTGLKYSQYGSSEPNGSQKGKNYIQFIHGDKQLKGEIAFKYGDLRTTTISHHPTDADYAAEMVAEKLGQVRKEVRC